MEAIKTILMILGAWTAISFALLALWCGCQTVRNRIDSWECKRAAKRQVKKAKARRIEAQQNANIQYINQILSAS